MALSPGTRLGPYEIVAPVGAGGMGEVYKARDTRLERTVAIKVLPSHLAKDAALRERFEREARAISSLNHPHICTLHDVGHQDGVDYLVMELLEGETLAERVKRGPLPPEQVLRHAVEIADGLDRAHKQGIVHRDLKPGNVMLTKSGAKLMDFGLAKQHGAGAGALVSTLRTESRNLTAEGTILGTFQYMAPEQLEGKDADARTDIFAFGALLYEMATGQRAFAGKSQASLIAAILGADPPPVSTLAPMSPPALDRVVRVCLAKEPDERWQSAHDLLAELKWIAEGGSQAGVAAPVAARRRLRERLVTGLVGLALGAASAAVIPFLRGRPDPAEAIRFDVYPPEGAVIGGGQVAQSLVGAAAVSPDGRQLAFVASTAQGRRLWVRPLDSLAARPLPGTDAAIYPFWSPDSRSIGFFANRQLKRIDVSGGPAQTVCPADAPTPRGGTWSRDDVILFALIPEAGKGLLRVPARGGIPTPVTTLDERAGDTSHEWPYFLPDSRRFLFLGLNRDPQKSGIYVGSLDSSERKLVMQAQSNAEYARSGHLLFVREQALMAQPFDSRRAEATGEPVAVAEQIDFNPVNHRGTFSLSDKGVLVYAASGGSGAQGAWFDRTGKRIGTLDAMSHFEISPDGSRVAAERFELQTATRDIWVFDLTRDTPSRFTFSPAMDWVPAWSPDGTRIAFTSDRDGPSGIGQLYQRLASGAGQDELLLKTSENKHHLHWSPDGRFLAFESNGPRTRQDIWILPLAGDRKPTVYLQTEFAEGQPQFSPDGRLLAYASDESGTFQVYVQTFPATGGKWQAPTAGGVQPRWRRDGGELYYLAADRKIMAVEIDRKSASFGPGVPRPLFQTAVSGNTLAIHFAATGDGQRFLLQALPEQSQSAITVVVNWTAGLGR